MLQGLQYIHSMSADHGERLSFVGVFLLLELFDIGSLETRSVCRFHLVQCKECLCVLVEVHLMAM